MIIIYSRTNFDANQEADDGGNIDISLNPDMLVNGFCQLGRMVDLRWDLWPQVLGRYEQGMDNVQ